MEEYWYRWGKIFGRLAFYTWVITKHGNKYSGVWYNVAYQRRQSNLERIGCPVAPAMSHYFLFALNVHILLIAGSAVGHYFR